MSVLIEEDSGAKERFYFARGSLPRGDFQTLTVVWQITCPLGRLAELTPGDSIELSFPNKREVTIIERVRLIPINSARDGMAAMIV